MQKPNMICKLQAGKFIGNQRNFVDTFNWTSDAMSNLKEGHAIDIEWGDGSHPIIAVDESELSGLGGGGKIEGYAGTTAEALSGLFVFQSASDSNVHISCNGNTVSFGVYYV